MMGSVSFGLLVVVTVVALAGSLSFGLTDPRDVAAINGLYVSLGNPPLDKWLPVGGDPCEDEWQGVLCVFSNVTEISLSGLNLGGSLGDSLGNLQSVINIDFSNNHIGGPIPSNLPVTLRNLSLAGNQLIGNIPESLASLSQLMDLRFNNNHLSGGIPDAFQPLTVLTNLDMADNNLTGQLPPSMADLLALKILHLQNNKLSGFLNVLQDIVLNDLNIENNLFSGPIPENLLAIPNFRRDGNPFNTTILPSPPAAQPLAPTPAEAPSSTDKAPRVQSGAPATIGISSSSSKTKNFSTMTLVVWIAVIVGFILFGLGICFLMWKCCKGKEKNRDAERNSGGVYFDAEEKSNDNKPSIQPVARESVIKMKDGHGLDSGRMVTSSVPQDEQLPPPPMALPHVEKVTAKPLAPAVVAIKNHPPMTLKSGAVNVFSIASLQQYTNSFSEDNFIGEGMLGSVYRAELPDGKLVAVKKLSTTASRRQSDEEFLKLVSRISELRHDNIVELVGYCNEHGQRLLAYEYCANGTLHDMLHVDEESHKKFSWNMRIRVALGAARALQYLHEGCEPPVVHRNFKSTNILLDEKFVVHVSDCGLATLLSSGSTSELSGRLLTEHGYSAPEFESGSYTCQSDVYSLGVVMLELLTGRKSFDRSRPRGEHFLVRWAIPRLHDIDALSRMVDPTLNGAYPAKSLSRYADIISRCVQWEPGFRPPMSEVVQDLLQMI